MMRTTTVHPLKQFLLTQTLAKFTMVSQTIIITNVSSNSIIYVQNVEVKHTEKQCNKKFRETCIITHFLSAHRDIVASAVYHHKELIRKSNCLLLS
jgi:hypothetical protein